MTRLTEVTRLSNMRNWQYPFSVSQAITIKISMCIWFSYISPLLPKSPKIHCFPKGPLKQGYLLQSSSISRYIHSLQTWMGQTGSRVICWVCSWHKLLPTAQKCRDTSSRIWNSGNRNYLVSLDALKSSWSLPSQGSSIALATSNHPKKKMNFRMRKMGKPMWGMLVTSCSEKRATAK